VQLETVEPAYRGLAAAGIDAEDAVLLDAGHMTAASEVESMKLMPVHGPRCVCK